VNGWDLPAFDLAAHLRDAHGVDPAAVAAAEAEGPEQLRRLAQAVVLLGEAPRLRPPDAWERTGADEDLARALWRAMGFAHVPDAVLRDKVAICPVRIPFDELAAFVRAKAPSTPAGSTLAALPPSDAAR